MDTAKYAEQVSDIAMSVGDGWGEEADAARTKLQEAVYLLGIADWTHRVRVLLAALEVDHEYLYEDSQWERPALYYGERKLDAGSFAIYRRQGVTGVPDYVHLAIRTVDTADRANVINALIGAGLVDGWDGDDVQFESAHSPYGCISVGVGPARHPHA